MRIVLFSFIAMAISTETLADLPLKETSNAWLFQGLFALLLATVLLAFVALILWWIRKRFLPDHAKTRSAMAGIFPEQKIQVRSVKKISPKTRITLIEVDRQQYLVSDNGQSLHMLLHTPLVSAGEENNTKEGDAK